ncbi:hypothetical protein [Aliarcobacter skirrowii]|uniref:hypothetical protein n=1 Tax=Aliarcobacter skirrowii TaxID=28200 RepID=UPI0029AFBBD6|nr:hypothetical protein [Aliarcobacter skirrowii]MDX4036570.1 hypothetical protein [Aliarcobacter skirrowii]
MEKFNLDDIVDFYIKTINVPENTKVNIGLTPLDINQNSFDNKMVNDTTTVKKYQGKELAKYPFIPRDIIKELKINEKDVFYIKGWIDANNDEEISVDYNEEVVAKIVKCYCYRDFTVDEVKKIVKDLRDSEETTKGNYDLFTAENCKLPQNERTYERFTEELNKTFRKYEINTCLRKIHFLAQAYVESDKFKTVEEYESIYTKNYIPFQGRGIKQITHDYNYLEYYDYINKTNLFNIYQKYNQGRGRKVKIFIGKDPALNNSFYEILKEFSQKLSNSIEYAFDSAGWYWNKNKINDFADNDNIEYVSRKVNLPYGKIENILGLEARKKYTKTLKKVFKYEDCSENN